MDLFEGGRNARFGGRRDKNPARGNGGGLGMSRGTHPVDLLEGGAAAKPDDYCVGKRIGSYWFRNAEKSPDLQAGGAVRAAAEVD